MLIRRLILFIGEGSLSIRGIYLSLPLVISYIIISITKRAQYPFSMWLPLAIDAPTPVSALVHRSTLVTAGLFLIARIIPESYNPYLLLIGGVTICVGGFCAYNSTDLKKLIANSTLSNLGLMAFVLSLSNKELMVLHLYTHALFKAGLFITAGALLIRTFGVQDSRALYGGGQVNSILGPLLRVFFVCSMGIFFLSTFFSKHHIVLIVQMSAVNILSLVIVILGVVLTTLYSIRFTYLILSSKRKVTLRAEVNPMVLTSIGLLALSSVMYGNYASSHLLRCVGCYEIPVNSLVLAGVVLFALSKNSMHRKTRSRMFEIDSIIDCLGKARRRIRALRSSDMGFGSPEYTASVKDINFPSSLIIRTLSPSRVNLSLIMVGLC